MLFIVAYWADTMESTPAAERPWYFRPHRIFVVSNVALYVIAAGNCVILLAISYGVISA
jgi:hypothetical protein